MISLLDPRWTSFIRVAESGSLTRAAVHLNVPQSMISRHVAQLERDCGNRLFRRTGRGVVLTEFGEQVFPRVQALIADAERLSDSIRTSGGVPAGEVRVGLLPSTVPMLASVLYAKVRESFPRVHLHLSEGASRHIEEQLNEGRLDMGLLLREGPSSAVQESVLAQFHLVLVGPRDAPLLRKGAVALAELEGVPLVVPSRPHPLRARLDSLAEARGMRLNIAVEADSIRLQHEVVAGGGGYALTSGLFEPRSGGPLACARIVKPALPRSVVLAHTVRRPHTLATREVQRLIGLVAPALLK
ncbi:MAG: LysR family transcriptional regulator [Pigmentiphaga sp.]|uniref:LysR family transcriptional regulator n=1 Tax=Pigmentiphaga sp. TaxID=1977564 RepID=UPI003B56E4D3